MKKVLVVFVCVVLAFGASASLAEVLQYKGEDMTVERFIAMCNAGASEDVRAIVALGVDINMRVEHGNTFLMFLAQENLPIAIKTLVAAGADLEARNNAGYTALMAAIHSDSAAAVKALVECGADVNTARNDGMNALMLAEQKGNEEIIKTLRDAGAKVIFVDVVETTSQDAAQTTSQDIH